MNIIPSSLGADDKIGVFILLQMIQAKLPGIYAFHVGEECGCIGSQFSSAAMKEQFKNVQKCIAFDRMNYGDVIATQRGRRCASVQFTNAVADALNEQLPNKNVHQFKGDVVGMYTDSANYDSYISECTNISVGYWSQHSEMEHFDAVWLMSLLVPAILKVNWNDIPISRDPTKTHETTWQSHNYGRKYQAANEEFVQLTLDDIKKVEYSTPLAEVPLWEPKMGIIEGATPLAMKRLHSAYIVRTLTKNSFAMTKISEDYTEVLKNYQTQIKALNKKLTKAYEDIQELAGKQIDKIDLGSKELTGRQLKKLTRVTRMCENVISKFPEAAMKHHVGMAQKEELSLELKKILSTMVGDAIFTRGRYEEVMEFAHRVYFLTRTDFILTSGLEMRSLSNKMKNILEC